MTLSVLFDISDDNADKLIKKAEFLKKTKDLYMNLTDEEFEALYRKLGLNADTFITYHRFLALFANTVTL